MIQLPVKQSSLKKHSVIQLNYTKRKNSTLFDDFRNLKDFKDIQNYIPIYNVLFELNHTNYNSFNLNHNTYVSSISESNVDANANANLSNKCILKNNLDIEIHSDIHIKQAPVLDPFKYLIGKYKFNTDDCKLPSLHHDENNFIHPDLFSKLYDVNNSAYVDGFFTYLSGEILRQYQFIHGIEFYGSFFGIKKNFKINILDDIDYLYKSDYFVNNNGKLFFVDDYSKITKELDSNDKLPLIQIDHDNRENISVSSIKDDIFEDVFDTNKEKTDDDTLEEVDNNVFLEMDASFNYNSSLKSSSSCSSRTSLTEEEEDDDEDDEDVDEEEDEDEEEEDEEEDEKEGDKEDDDDDDETSSSFEEDIFATIPIFPVNIICMEKFEDTLDNLIISDSIKSMDEWFAILMQVIMTLIAYQKCFSFTHNDLHTNNIMYMPTNVPYLFYCYNHKYYKVPTHGRIFKIIDFGRSIYKVNNRTFCSDSFKKGEDAATQYNMEPYFNEKKPRIEPNYSFDLCRLACSIFDYIVDDMREIEDLKSCSPIIRLIVEWCLDDNGLNVLYKSNGDERYEDFKLYKMIARSVHKHTPQNQLERKEFKQFLIEKKKLSKQSTIMNIDSMPTS
jgi:hypothetical protein